MNARAPHGIRALAGCLLLFAAASAVLPARAAARALSVELWTDKGNDAVYLPGDPILIKSRTSDDAYLIVYEIDAEGGVHLLFPGEGHSSAVEARRTYRLPDDDRAELVVDNTTGQGYIVAIASREPFDDLPWYLRPWNEQALEIGFVGEEDEEEGITAEGRIVGDPFVAMERIRRRVLRHPNDEASFATVYTSYYVHDRVRYPRYICYDCHRPGLYQWWAGFDPYYTTCSVFDFRVNWSWGWGPRYWFGSVPYFVYVYRPDCPPEYRGHTGGWYSSWDGWNRWCDLWGNGGLRRYRTVPPPNYVPPDQYFTRDRTRRELPPGFLASAGVDKGGIRQRVGVGAGREWVGGEGIRERTGDRERRGDSDVRDPRRQPRPDGPAREQGAGDIRTPRQGWGIGRGSRTAAPSPGLRPSRDDSPRETRAPERPREEYRAPQPPPQREPRREERPVYRAPDPPRQERAPERPRPEPQRAPDPPQYRAPDPPRQERAPDPPKPADHGNRGGDERGGGGRSRR